MKLHIFNPEHDLALAANQDNYTAPHAGRQLRRDLGFVPALWADEGDLVLVEDIDDAYDKLRHLPYINKVEFITPLQLEQVFRKTMLVDSVHPWGWDRALVAQLEALGCPEIMLPRMCTLQSIRMLSGRAWAADHLQVQVDYVSDLEGLKDSVQVKGKSVIKAPWSSSGRGIRYVSMLDDATLNWASNIIRQQGGVTVEPFYNKVRDFGMEFDVKDGKVSYRGLSIFDTIKGAYMGNVLASEEEKAEILSDYIDVDELSAIRQRIIAKMEPVLHNIYCGPFGVDMMIYADVDGRMKVNPCVELNLRRTMGHVALDLGTMENATAHLMKVDFDGNRYRIRVLPGRPSEEAPMH